MQDLFLGHGVSLGHVIAFCVVFFLAGHIYGRLFRHVPPMFGLLYDPNRGWLYGLCCFGFAFLSFELREIQSFVVYGIVMREGTIPLLWALLMAYGVGTGYSGRSWFFPMPHVRQWSTGKRAIDEKVERRIDDDLKRDQSR